MNTKTALKPALYWTPRILAILVILFISIFSLDVFGEGYGFFETIAALFMHLIPSFILAGITVLAWKNETAGGIAFIVLGIAFTIFFSAYKQLATFLLICLPVFVIGGLFLLSKRVKK